MSPTLLLLQRINALGIVYGREDLFKQTRQRLIQDRMVIGMDSRSCPTQAKTATALSF